MNLLNRLREHEIKIQAFIKVLYREDGDVNIQQLEGVLITLSNTLDTLLNEP